MLEEFKKFALRGNAVDLAIGIVIGAAFGAVVNSLVGDLIMPIIGAVTGGLDFSNYYIPLSHKITAGAAYLDAKKQGAVLGYGEFITVVISFLIVSACLFFVVRGMNVLAQLQSKKADAEPPSPDLPPDVKLLAEIRDLLKSRPAV